MTLGSTAAFTEHADLWELLGQELRGRASSVSVSWVKGHATSVDIARGRSTTIDKRGNDGADAPAVVGARLHRVSPDVVQAAKQRRLTAESVRRMMLAILKARFAAERAGTSDAADRGSECGDCTFCFDLDDDIDGDITLCSER